MGHIFSGLKDLALQLKAPILSLAELNVPVALVPKESPQPNHLIHHDQDLRYLHDHADKVVLVDRPQQAEGPEYDKYLRMVRVNKNRHGFTGTVKLNYDPICYKFSDWVEDDVPF